MVEYGAFVVWENDSNACYKSVVVVKQMMWMVRCKIAKSFFKDRIVEELFIVVNLVLWTVGEKYFNMDLQSFALYQAIPLCYEPREGARRFDVRIQGPVQGIWW